MKPKLFSILAVLLFVVVALPGCNSSQPVSKGAESANRGDADMENEQYEGAIKSYSAAIDADPSLTDFVYKRGMAYFKSGQYDNAIADMQRVAASDPKMAFAHYYSGQAYAAKGEFEKAADSFTSAIEVNPLDATFVLGRARAYEKLGRADAAQADLDKVRQLDPELVKP